GRPDLAAAAGRRHAAGQACDPPKGRFRGGLRSLRAGGRTARARAERARHISPRGRDGGPLASRRACGRPGRRTPAALRARAQCADRCRAGGAAAAKPVVERRPHHALTWGTPNGFPQTPRLIWGTRAASPKPPPLPVAGARPPPPPLLFVAPRRLPP